MLLTVGTVRTGISLLRHFFNIYYQNSVNSTILILYFYLVNHSLKYPFIRSRDSFVPLLTVGIIFLGCNPEMNILSSLKLLCSLYGTPNIVTTPRVMGLISSIEDNALLNVHPLGLKASNLSYPRDLYASK